MGLYSDMSNESNTRRSLRPKLRKHYHEGEDQDAAIEGHRTFDLEDKITCRHFGNKMVKRMKGEDFTYKYIQEHGFTQPMLFHQHDGLGLVVPGKEFSVNDVKICVGSRRMVDAMDVNSQKAVEMSMAQFAKYYESEERDGLYNVISLEFSHTKLDELVQKPYVVQLLDWVDTVWPRELKETQKDSTNVLAEMKYPKVQKYCLMSVAGCFTDFHVDFGGTSVWYHILHGQKIFWLIPPTDENLNIFESWVLSGKQGDVFLGDRVKQCGRIKLESGDTFFIPSGWIHAVYTPEDSLVFGGNFLHSFNIPKQLRVSALEDKIHVPFKFRYPFYGEIMWYVMASYINVLLGRTHIQSLKNKDLKKEIIEKKENGGDAMDEKIKEERSPQRELLSGKENQPDSNGIEKPSTSQYDEVLSTQSDDNQSTNQKEEPLEANNKELSEKSAKVEMKDKSSAGYKHLSKYELEGLKMLLWHLEALYKQPQGKRCVPDLIENPKHVLADAREMLDMHVSDKANLAVTGEPVVKKLEVPQVKKNVSASNLKFKPGNANRPRSKAGVIISARRRRTRCRNCDNCLRSDCGQCNFCKDMKKFGGPGRMKQSCINRQCLAPILPACATCSLCGYEVQEGKELMECHQCNDIVHPACLQAKGQPNEGVVNADLPNSWECPKCIAADSKSEKSEDTLKSDSSTMKKVKQAKKRQQQDANSPVSNSAEKMSKKSKSESSSPVLRSKRLSVQRSTTKPSQAKNSPSPPAKKRRGPPGNNPVSPLTKRRTLITSPRGRKKAGGIRQKILSNNKLLRSKWNGIIQAQRNGRGGGSGDAHTVARQEKAKPVQVKRFVVRPGRVSPPPLVNTQGDCNRHAYEWGIWKNVFAFLSAKDLCRCISVCKTWNRWGCDADFWKNLDLSNLHKLSKSTMSGIIRRQPISLNMTRTNISRRQLIWLLERLPNLKELHLGYTAWDVASALSGPNSPLLEVLDLKWVEGLKDNITNNIFQPPVEHRPGMVDVRSRMRCLQELYISGTDITDNIFELLVQNTPALKKLDVSFCTHLTPNGIDIFLEEDSTIRNNLTDLNVYRCYKITGQSLYKYLLRLSNLRRLTISKTQDPGRILNEASTTIQHLD
ncbi:lysine-specific demethylase 2B-like [Anneissia japonica]|uniref:lysine-specific demethylase 2B-like n=1 Tax=Anneissia japonica TaxID=1529436 RepID=UPI00142589F8|nr:lysine-specific demethylase 2B-like [Anneissia japonica]